MERRAPAKTALAGEQGIFPYSVQAQRPSRRSRPLLYFVIPWSTNESRLDSLHKAGSCQRITTCEGKGTGAAFLSRYLTGYLKYKVIRGLSSITKTPVLGFALDVLLPTYLTQTELAVTLLPHSYYSLLSWYLPTLMISSYPLTIFLPLAILFR